MESHKRILSILYIVTGSFQLLLYIFLIALFSTFFPMIADEAGDEGRLILQMISTFLPALFVGLIILSSFPSIIGGVALLNGRKWALTLLLVIGCFKLLSFPIGTALGIYTIWVYAEDNRQSNIQSDVNVQA
jgi:hypothetical protein